MLRNLPIFRFSQVEVPWLLGPPDGRYLVRDDERQPTHVLLFATLSAERKRSRRSARQRTAAREPAPVQVSTQRVTIVGAGSPFTDEPAARGWLAAAGEDDLGPDLATLETVLHTFSAVTADPGRRVPGRDQLLVARIGYGDGEQVAYGKWTEAHELLAATPRQKRSKVLEPQARLAAALGQRTPVLICEDLALQARCDLDAGRHRTAALQLTIAIDAALTELTANMAADMKARTDELATQLEPVTDAATAALRGDLTADQLKTVRFTLGRIEAALRARAVAAS